MILRECLQASARNITGSDRTGYAPPLNNTTPPPPTVLLPVHHSAPQYIDSSRINIFSQTTLVSMARLVRSTAGTVLTGATDVAACSAATNRTIYTVGARVLTEANLVSRFNIFIFCPTLI